jgi:hypothetical protein
MISVAYSIFCCSRERPTLVTSVMKSSCEDLNLKDEGTEMPPI